MKKEQIILIRVMSVAGLLAALAFLLIFGLGGGLYTNVINRINENSFDDRFAQNIVQSLYYYKGMNVVYQIVYAFNLFLTVFACVGVFLRKRGAAVFAKLAVIASLITSVYVLVSIFAQNSAFCVKLVAGAFIKDISAVSLENMLGVLPIIVAILMIIFSVLTLLLIKSSGMLNMKMYAASFKSKTFDVLIPLVFGVIFLEVIRPLIIELACGNSNSMDGISAQVNTFITDYYFGNSFLFDMPYVWFVLIAALLSILPNEKIMAKIKSKLLLMMVLASVLLISIRSLVYLLNPPRLFGYLTLDQKICDVTETVYPIYMLMFLTDIILIIVLTYLSVRTDIGAKKILILSVVNACISIVAAIAASFLGITFIYAAAVAADVIALVGCFYVANISRRNH